MRHTIDTRPARSEPSPDRACPRARAFSLLELVVVIIVVGVFAAIAVPRAAVSAGRYRVQAAARRLAEDLRAAQRQAVASSAPASFAFGTTTSTYAWSLKVDSISVGERVCLLSPPFDAVLSSVSAGGDRILVFSGRGAPDSAATVTIANGRNACQVLVSAAGEITVGSPYLLPLAIARPVLTADSADAEVDALRPKDAVTSAVALEPL